MFDFGWITATLILMVLTVVVSLIKTGKPENYWLAGAFFVSLIGARLGSSVESPVILIVFLSVSACLSWKSGTYGARIVSAIYSIRIIITGISHLYAINFVYLGDVTNAFLLVQLAVGGFIAGNRERITSGYSGVRFYRRRANRISCLLSSRYHT